MAARVTEWHGDEVFKQLLHKVEGNANRVGLHLANKVKLKIRVGQEKKKLKSGRIVGLTKATKGDPPRVLTGRLRQSIDHRVISGTHGKTSGRRGEVVVKVGAHTEYARALELSHPKTGAHHPFLIPTLNEERLKVVALFVRGLV